MARFDRQLKAVIGGFLRRLLGRSVAPQTVETCYEFIKFGIVGLSNTILSYLIYLIAWKLLTGLSVSGMWRYQLANLMAFLLAVLWSFYWNNRLVFTTNHNQRHFWTALLKTYIAYSVIGLFLNSLLLMLWVDLIGISELLAPILNLVISVPINFLLNKFWAFN